jgi:hypothetical protein
LARRHSSPVHKRVAISGGGQLRSTRRQKRMMRWLRIGAAWLAACSDHSASKSDGGHDERRRGRGGRCRRFGPDPEPVPAGGALTHSADGDHHPGQAQRRQQLYRALALGVRRGLSRRLRRVPHLQRSADARAARCVGRRWSRCATRRWWRRNRLHTKLALGSASDEVLPVEEEAWKLCAAR